MEHSVWTAYMALHAPLLFRKKEIYWAPGEEDEVGCRISIIAPGQVAMAKFT